ncbi:MAG TPA: MFS transporter [Bryobacteraceae bacterium]|jgi:predicted MFS family arabinose efflux permease
MRRARVFYGWWVVLASGFALLIGPVPVLVFSFGVFLKPLATEFHATRGATSLALTLHNTIAGFGIAFAGRLVDRFGPRRVILPAMIMTGLILLSSYLCSASIWQLYAFFLAAGLFGSGVAPVSFATVVSHWFDRRRGLALGLMLLGMGLGAVIMPSVAERLIEGFGWRFAYAAIGTAMLLVAVPVTGALLKDDPEQMGLVPDGASRAATLPALTRDNPGCSLREALHARTFWLLLCAFVLVSASVHACFTHIAAILTDRGSSVQAAALASSLFGGGVLIGRAASGYLLDRFFAPRVAAVIFGCAAAGVALLGTTTSQPLAFIAALLIGLGWGTEGDVKAYLISRYFGLRSFGAIFGFTFAAFVLAGGLGAYLMGAVFDAKRSYGFGLTLACIGVSLSAALIMLLGPYRYRIGTPVEARPDFEMLSSESQYPQAQPE